MSIKEALERGGGEIGMKETGKVLMRTNGIDALRLKFTADMYLLDQARVPALCAELAVIIKQEFSDVENEEVKSLNGVSRSITWNHRDKTFPDFKPNMSPIRVVSMITVTPDPLNSELAIEGQEVEILKLEQWSHPRVLEDAIVRAYRSPLCIVDDQIQIDPIRRVKA